MNKFTFCYRQWLLVVLAIVCPKLSTAQINSGGSHSTQNHQKQVIGYITNWDAWKDQSYGIPAKGAFNHLNIDYSQYTILNYSFFGVAQDGSLHGGDYRNKQIHQSNAVQAPAPLLHADIYSSWELHILLGELEPVQWIDAAAKVKAEAQGFVVQEGSNTWSHPGWGVSNQPLPLPLKKDGGAKGLLDLAHEKGVKVMAAIGGWSMSKHFPEMAADPQKRQKFINDCERLIRMGFDGIDLDWEFPGPFEGMNFTGSTADYQNLTTLVTELRTRLNSLGSGKLINIAFSGSPAKLQNIEWNKLTPLVDYFGIMTYDYNGGWSNKTAHNTPLYNYTGATHTDFNVNSSIQTLLQLGVPKSKINIGAANYGRGVVTQGAAALNAPTQKVNRFVSPDGDISTAADFTNWGKFDGAPFYSYIVQQALQPNSGWTRHWDNEAKVPYLTKGNFFLSYDDVQSIEHKAKFVNDQQLAGVIVWSVYGDLQMSGSATSKGSHLKYVANTQSPLVNTLNRVFATGNGGNSGNIAPVVNLTQPGNNAQFELGQIIPIAANASDADGSVSKVTFYANNLLLSTDTSAPYSFSWSNTTQGTYTLKAIATDDQGQTTTSTSITVEIKAADNGGGNCGNIPAWDAGKVYSAAGNIVSYQGKKYRNKWWTKGDNPTQNMAANPWELLGNCGSADHTLTISSPTPNSEIVAGQSVNVKAEWNGNTGDIAKVVFYANGQLLTEKTDSPYAFSWSVQTIGNVILLAKALDDNGKELAQDAITITVKDSSTGNSCAGVPVWDASKVYAAAGNIVSYQGKKYRNKWWTKGDNPTQSMDANPWELLGNCGGSTNQKPTVNITQPASNSNFTQGQNIEVKATAQDADGSISKVSFYANNLLLGIVYDAPYELNWQNPPSGNYQLKAIAEDNEGASTTSALVTVKVNTLQNQAPNVNIITPVNGATIPLGNMISIEANANDTDGQITKVAFYANGQKLGEASNQPYRITWNNVAEGTYQLTAMATDNEGLTTTSTVHTVTVGETTPPHSSLPKNIVVGYWHNWNLSSAPYMALQDVPSGYNVICVAFAIPVSHTDMTMTFTPSEVSKEAFKADIKAVQQKGTKVLISIGGANAPVELKNDADREKFITSMRNIIQEYGFDGLDIDLEGSSVILNSGDTDFKNPTTPKVINLIAATRTLCNEFGNEFILSAAPEVQYLQGGFANYGTAFGGYLPVIHALRDKLTYVHPQLYNTGSQFGYDNQIYAQSTADFMVAMTELLLKGFPVGRNTNSIFSPLREDQVAIGLPAKPAAAPAGGYLAPNEVHKALNYLTKGVSFGGRYTLQNATGYPNLRGLMTWSINWDKTNGYEFVNNHHNYFNSQTTQHQKTSSVHLSNFPNPVERTTTVTLKTNTEATTSIVIYNRFGNKVATVCPSQTIKKGQYSFTVDMQGLPVGMYYCSVIRYGMVVKSVKIIKK
ncbi:glycosyl hydrolase family 18 protein [uncultured Microscilla sp.]|uniref:glycosyl hydrolase family 18 protein n=1 Tax=uncultured Microscilla sp. TaxID=432653 RepID=UPI00261CD4D1|nr:glycosyl hydrolase family 18 protein [uncultured Microscilla sp.]